MCHARWGIAVVVGIALAPAAARADCVDLPSIQRPVDLPSGWRVEAGSATDLLWNDGLGGVAPAVSVAGPFEDSCAAFQKQRGTGWVEVSERPAAYGARYARFWAQAEQQRLDGCLDTDDGAYLVALAQAGRDATDARWLEITERIADGLTSGACAPAVAPVEPAPVESVSAPPVSDGSSICYRLPGIEREMNVPAEWTVYAHTVTGEPDVFTAGDQGTVTVAPPREGSCATLTAGIDAAPVPFSVPGGYAGVWGDDWMWSACLDTPSGPMWVEGDRVGADSSIFLPILAAIAEMATTDVTCPWETDAGTVPVTRGRAPSLGEATLALGAGNHALDASAELTIHRHGLAFAIDGRAGVGLDGGLLYGFGVHPGVRFGRAHAVSVLGFAGVRGITGGHVPLGLGFGVDAAVEWPLTRRLRLLVTAGARWFSDVVAQPAPMPSEFGPLGLEPRLTAAVTRGRLLAGVRVEAFGSTVMVGAIVGLRFDQLR